jgi:thymidylate synthase
VRAYLDILQRIVTYGWDKHPTRVESGPTSNATIGLPNQHFSWDLCDGFPLLTTRKLPWKNIVGELRSFLEGRTDNRDFVKNGCSFWQPWADKAGTDDLGPIYGNQWNNHGQLKHVLDCLRNNPQDRRMVVSAWRPDEHKYMVLPPCHLMFDVVVYNNTVSLSWFQRSCDFPIGVPCNIASYALLTHLFAKWAGMQAGNLSCIFCDAHVYLNQLPGVREQLRREPGELSEVKVRFKDKEDFLSWECELGNYNPQANIKFGDLEV